MAIGIAAMVSPLAYGSATPMPSDLINVGIALTAEVILGLMLGSIIMLAVLSLQLAGQAVGHLAGLDLATAVDPASDEQMPVISNLLGMLAMVILVSVGGHREMLQCCLDSFETIPAGTVAFQASWLGQFEAILTHTFVIGIRAAAPLATALLLANVMTGLLARTLPQLNVLAIGFNINALSLLVLLFMSVGSVTWVFQSELATWIEGCQRVIITDL